MHRIKKQKVCKGAFFPHFGQAENFFYTLKKRIVVQKKTIKKFFLKNDVSCNPDVTFEVYNEHMFREQEERKINLAKGRKKQMFFLSTL